MKKIMILCAAACAMMAFTSCKSSESAYKKAYEKARAQDAAQQGDGYPTTDAPVVTPITTVPATQTTTVDNYDNVSVRQENLTVVSGSGLKNFSVVVGSFSMKANAEGLQQTLRAAGYDAQLAFNSERNMYRVIASTFDSKGDAVQSRDQFRAKYPDAWLLFNQR